MTIVTTTYMATARARVMDGVCLRIQWTARTTVVEGHTSVSSPILMNGTIAYTVATATFTGSCDGVTMRTRVAMPRGATMA